MITQTCNPNFPEMFADSTICVTGYNGYVGRHLLNAVISAGIKPVIIGRPRQCVSNIVGSVVLPSWNDAGELAGHLEKLKNPVILNLAGYFISSHSPENICSLVSGNLQFPLEIFEALSLSGHSRIVNIGTSWEYSDNGEKKPANLYANLKAANAQHLKWYVQNFPLRAINLKLNDTFGGNDTREKLLPYLKQCWRDGQKAKLYSSSQLINLLHITEVIGGILHAAEQTKYLDSHEELTVFLLGDCTVSIGELIDTINKKVTPELSVQFEESPRSTSVLRGVWEDAPRLAGWAPRLTLSKGLKNYFMDEDGYKI